MNTVEALDQLEQVAFTTEQAKAIVRIFEKNQRQPATKENIGQLKESIGQLEARLMADIDTKILKAKYDLIKWIIGGIVANGAIVAIMLKLLL